MGSSAPETRFARPRISRVLVQRRVQTKSKNTMIHGTAKGRGETLTVGAGACLHSAGAPSPYKDSRVYGGFHQGPWTTNALGIKFRLLNTPSGSA